MHVAYYHFHWRVMLVRNLFNVKINVYTQYRSIINLLWHNICQHKITAAYIIQTAIKQWLHKARNVGWWKIANYSYLVTVSMMNVSISLTNHCMHAERDFSDEVNKSDAPLCAFISIISTRRCARHFFAKSSTTTLSAFPSSLARIKAQPL